MTFLHPSFHTVLAQSGIAGWENPCLPCKRAGAIHSRWSWFSKLRSLQSSCSGSNGVPHHCFLLRKICILFWEMVLWMYHLAFFFLKKKTNTTSVPNILRCYLHSCSPLSSSRCACVPLLAGGFPLVHDSLPRAPSCLVTFSHWQFQPPLVVCCLCSAFFMLWKNQRSGATSHNS